MTGTEERGQTTKVIPAIAPVIVKPRGPEDSPFVIVGEAPGVNEVKQGAPFVGPSGVVLDAALSQFRKGSFPEPLICNAVPHLMPKNKDNNVMAALAQKWQEDLYSIIKKHPRKIILALGNVALWSLTKNYGLKITQCRGNLFKAEELSELGVVAATHPAFLLRGNGSLRQFKADVAYAISLARGGKPHEFVPPTWEVISTTADLKRFVDHGMSLPAGSQVAGDIETTGFKYRVDKVLVSGYSFDGSHVYVIPGQKQEYLKSGQDDLHYHPQLKLLFENPNLRFNWHNGKFDIKFLRYHYNLPAVVHDDTMLMSYALDETRGVHDLETVAFDWLNSPKWKNILDSHKKTAESYDIIPVDVLNKYMAYDIANTFRLKELLWSLIEEDNYAKLQYEKTLIPASAYLTEIEWNGLKVDTDKVEENRIEYQSIADKHREAFNQIAIEAGYGPINPNSPIQVSDFLFNTLKLPTKHGRGTGKDILEKLPQVPAVVELQKYRKINKGLTTYVTPLPSHMHDDGRVHSTYLIHGTATGRLASRDPNIQNIPREPKLRGQFIPAPGKCFAEVDLNQAELRSLAALSGDPELCRIYSDPTSKGLHEEVRAEIYGYSEDWSPSQLQQYFDKWYTQEVKRVLEEQKMRAKNVNFGIVYGITAAGLSEQIEDSTFAAQTMLNAWARKFPVAWGFINSCKMAPIRGQNLRTPFGYRKRFQIVTPETVKDIQNEAANFPHQSIASTITVHGGMRCQKRLLQEFDTLIVNTVHDSILLELPLEKDLIVGATNYLIHELEQVPIDWGITRIPFKAEAKAGLRWGHLVDLDKFLKAQFSGEDH